MSDTITTTPVTPAGPPRRKHSRRFRVLRAAGIGFAGLVVIGAVSSAIGGPQAKPAAAVTAPSATVTATATVTARPTVTATATATVTARPTVTATATAPAAPATMAPAAPATTAPAAPAITESEQQALTSAQSYLSDGEGFSRDGLIGQLDSPDGEGFSVADATWAVDHSGANWDDQAVISAQGYLSDGEGFSRDGLIGQLDSPDGEGFTYAQAVYGVDKAGL